MKKNPLLFIPLVLVGFLKAQSPITLGNANMPGNGDTLRYTDIQLTTLGNYTQTGTNFTWDFSNVTSTTQGIRQFKSSLLTPYALFFLALNEYGEKIADSYGVGPVVINDYYNFYKKQTSPAAFIADGAGITFSSIPVPSYYSDKDELYNFPMTYPKYDSTTFRFATPATTIIPVRYSKTGYRVTRVDGWGTIKTPYGTENCLRLVTTQYSMDTVKVSVGPISFPAALPVNIRSYQWLSATAKIPVLEITGNLTGSNFAPVQARYRGYPSSGSTNIKQEEKELLKFYPNPVKNKLYLEMKLGVGRLEIYDVSGKCMMSFVTGTVESPQEVDVSQLVPGVYLVKVIQQNEILRYKFVKEVSN